MFIRRTLDESFHDIACAAVGPLIPRQPAFDLTTPRDTGPRILITGITGFAGSHLEELAHQQGAVVEGATRHALGNGARTRNQHTTLHRADLTSAQAVRELVASVQPDFIFHLAALASVALSWDDPGRTVGENVLSTLNLLEAAKSECPHTRILVASSGEIYGPPEQLPVDESAPLRPQNPYAVSKAAADLLAGQYADSSGLDVVRMRAFNHAGPRQSDTYMVGSFARQIAQGEADDPDGTLIVRTGNLETKRDFTDVRDIVRAYWLALERAPAGVYNVCSGRSVSGREIFDILESLAGVEVRRESDPTRFRKTDVMDIVGSGARIAEVTGWKPEISLNQTLADSLSWWRERMGTPLSP